MTGSTTRGNDVPRSSLATVRTISAEKSIPVFAARTSKSPRTARSCFRISGTGIEKIESTERVFWAVTHVITEVPCTPTEAKDFRSAWIPAPPPESLPAIVRAVRTGAPWREPA